MKMHVDLKCVELKSNLKSMENMFTLNFKNLEVIYYNISVLSIKPENVF